MNEAEYLMKNKNYEEQLIISELFQYTSKSQR